MRFVDLFAGLGGFNLALGRLGHQCVFASEIDEDLRFLYRSNFGLMPSGDIRQVNEREIPEHDILCAGFPCQPFSKAGMQFGLKDREVGRLYREILRVIGYRHPKFLILENVPNLQQHDDGQTWKKIERLLRREGYDVRIRKLSPHHFGIPQIRERVYIVGSLLPLHSFRWPEPLTDLKFSVKDVLEPKPSDAQPIPKLVQDCISIWQEFLDHVPKREKIPHPVWSMEFGATYPYKGATPFRIPVHELRRYRGAFGVQLRGDRKVEVFRFLPSHARRPQNRFPDWKINFIRKNREFYRRHKGWIDDWKEKVQRFPSSYQKLEWNCQGDRRIMKRYIIQIRASGVRVKRPTTAPSLVAMTSTQVPIVAWESRYMTRSECKRLQSMEDLKFLPQEHGKTYEALGNAINVEVATRVAEALLGPPVRRDVIPGKPASHWSDVQRASQPFGVGLLSGESA